MNKGGPHGPPFSCQQNNQFAFEGRPPVASAVPAAKAEKASLAAKGTGTLLLVEDETPLRMLAATSLNRIGYTVLEAGNGIEAPAAAEAHAGKIDVVAYIVMPQMGGPQLGG